MSGLTDDQLRFNLLRKQYLLAEEDLIYSDPAKTHLGLHSTDYWTPYLSVYARIGDYDPKIMFDALNKGDQLVRIHAFRRTVFVIHTDKLPVILQAMGPLLYKFARKAPDIKNMTEEELDKKIAIICELLEKQPLPTREIKKQLPELAPNLRSILYIAHAKGKITRATAKHAKSTQTSLASMKKWVPDFNLDTLSHKQALSMLISNYIRAFGPVTEEDIAWWTGYTRKYLREILETIKESSIVFEKGKSEYIVNKEDYEDALSINLPSEPIITFLPYEDHFPKAYRNRSWFIDTKLEEKLFPRNKKAFWPSTPSSTPNIPITSGMNQSGEIRPSIWLDSKIIGRWELDPLGKKADGFKVVMNLYHKVSSAIEEIISNKRENLEDFINERLLPIS